MARRAIRSVGALALAALTLFLAIPSAAQPRGAHVTAQDLARLNDIEGLSVSPDGRWVAFQLRRPLPELNVYDLAWYIAPTAGGAPWRLADGGLPVLYASAWPRSVNGSIRVAPPLWSPDSRSIIYVRRDGAGTQLWRSHIDGQRTEQLTHSPADVSDYDIIPAGNRISLHFRYSRDGRQLFFKTLGSEAQLAAALAEEGRTGYLFDDRFMPDRSMRPRAPRGASLQRGPSNTVAADGPRGVALWLYDFATRRERLATADEEAEYAALVQAQPAPTGPNAHGSAVSSSGGSLAWTEARDPSLQGATPPVTIVAKPQSAPSPIVCEARVCTSQFVGAWRWRNDGELLFNAFAPGSARLDERRLYAWRPGRDKEPRLILSTSGLYDSFAWDCGQAGDKLICFYEELDRPRRLVSIDLDNGAIGTLYDPNPTWARFDLGAPPRVIPVRTASGFEMHSYLVLPPNHRGSERLPLVIVSYVCSGFMRGGSGNEYPVYPLAAQGFAVLCFNLELNNLEAEARGPRSMPPEFAADDGDGFRELVQTGLDAAIDELDRMGVIDPDRVGITGLSAGAQMVEYAIIHRPRLAAAIESGTMLEAAIATTFCSRGGCEFLRQAGFGSPTSERWSTRAMSRNVERIRAPLLVNASDQEALGSVEPIRALQAAGRAAELYVYPDEHHIKWQPAHRLAIYNRNIDWMNFWLRGVESGLTGDPDQYMRWSAMRDRLCRAVKSGGIQSSSGAVRQPGPDKWKSGLAWYCLSDPVATAK